MQFQKLASCAWPSPLSMCESGHAGFDEAVAALHIIESLTGYHFTPTPRFLTSSYPHSIIPANSDTRTVAYSDRVLAHVRIYRPAHPASRRVLLVCHGALEHGGYYQHVAEGAVARGWEVVVADHRGHGASGGPRVHVHQFEQYISDVDRVIDTLNIAPDRLAILGHSMGGPMAVRYAQSHPDRLTALVLVAPLMKAALPINPFVLASGRIIALFAPRTRFATGIRPEDLSRNPEYLRRRAADPLVERRVTAAWYLACERAMQQLENTPQVAVPALVMQGTADCIVSPQAAIGWARRAGAEVLKLDGQKHCLLQEPEAAGTLCHILNWLDRQVRLAGEPTESPS